LGACGVEDSGGKFTRATKHYRIALEHRHITIVYTHSGSIISFLGLLGQQSSRASLQLLQRHVCPPSSGPVGAWPVTFGTQLYAYPDAFNGPLPLCNLRHIVFHILLFVYDFICNRHVPHIQLMTIASPLPIPYHGVSVAECSAAVCLVLFVPLKSFSHVGYIGTILSVNRGVERRTRHYFSDQVVRSQETRRAGRDRRYCSRLSQMTSGSLRRIRSRLQKGSFLDQRRAEYQGCHRAVSRRESFLSVIDRYLAQLVEPLQKHALTEDNIHELMFTKHKGSTFWQDVGE
jgi:hypothetical protein